MPIHAPSLPPVPQTGQGLPAALVLARFELRRLLRQRLGRFFGFAFLLVLLVDLGTLYLKHLVGSAGGFAQRFLPQGAGLQAGLLGHSLLGLLWLQVALVGGGLVARDTLFRIRPLLYAHPVSPVGYLAGKGLVAAGLPLLVQLPFILLPWALSLLVAGPRGPIWATAPLHLLPAALLIALLMGSLSLGASSLASTPRGGFAWCLGAVLGFGLLGHLLAGFLGQGAWEALGPAALAEAWPRLLCGAPATFGWLPVVAGSLLHGLGWLVLAHFRTRPGEALA
nr:hypothetical protein [uncultured Holophaga sp.]